VFCSDAIILPSIIGLSRGFLEKIFLNAKSLAAKTYDELDGAALL
jgi:hypothetical protein